MWEWVIVAVFALIGIVVALLLPRVFRLLGHVEQWGRSCRIRQTSSVTISRKKCVGNLSDEHSIIFLEPPPDQDFYIGSREADRLQRELAGVRANNSLLRRGIKSLRKDRTELNETCESLQIRTCAMRKWIVAQGDYIGKLESVVDDKEYIAEHKPEEAAAEFIEELRKAGYPASGS